ncbi:hypothetical protein Poli38472_005883 [Pythium oligandrum]|uniref:Calpain catalytic domain-containing protein n=1 Tax=Pythium oligandrum TaxID=41045 RepID=A0A8K1FLM8_PYTOL|nr:hypothetical protein Poli38472_005883 [Pythium oligandrum]|eukprot:TMW68415.1 hypothetical protein Poli38472_005883 [Pythium oligandrum]
MPPRKPPQASSQKSLQHVNGPTPSERQPLPPPVQPEPGTVAPLWTPTGVPNEIFPEWPGAAALATENWFSEDAPFEDAISLSAFPLPSSGDTITWKRPREIFTPIVEASPPAAALAPVVPDPKHAKKPPAPAAKKGEPEPPKKPPPAWYAHIVYVEPPVVHHEPSAHLPPPSSDPRKAAGASVPPTPAPILPIQPPPRRIIRDFRRLWSPEEFTRLTQWKKEEDRIEREKENRERVYMEFEDATAFIINDRPRGAYNEDSVSPDDLVDDGGDDDLEHDEADGDFGAQESLLYGVLPPPRISITENAIQKPEIPHGSVVNADIASYFRVIDQLYEQFSQNSDSPFLWEAIYPQDTHGIPIYNAGGKYTVKLFVMGKWRRIDVDDRLPVDEEGHIVFVSSYMKNEIWPSILAKALLKVFHWQFGNVSTVQHGTMVCSFDATRFTNSAVSALTGWKVSRCDDVLIPGSDYLQIFSQFVSPQIQNSLIVEEETDQLDLSAPEEVMDSDATTRSRVVLSCENEQGASGLAFREAVLLNAIVGDTGSVIFKGTNLNGPMSVAEEDLTRFRLGFLLVHPPSAFSDFVEVAWTKSPEGEHVPFTNAPSRVFVVELASVPRAGAEQSPGDSSSESAPIASPEFVDVIVTLTQVTSTSMPTQPNEARLIEPPPPADPGSVILVEDISYRNFQQKKQDQDSQFVDSAPLVFEINTFSSTRMRLPANQQSRWGFRVFPQQSCCYGYGIQIESQVKVESHFSSTYWRDLWGLQVIDGDGSYPAMLPFSWNVLFKQTIEFSPSDSVKAIPDVLVDLQISEAQVIPYVHISMINNQTNEVVQLAGLYSQVALPVGPDSTVLPTYTIVVECTPGASTIPEGKWRLTLGSSMPFKQASVHQPRMTAFGGTYEPNKPLICFRDVMIQPKKTAATSLDVKFVDEANEIMEDLTVKLQVIDLASQQVLSEVHGHGIVRLLQLPPYTKAADDPNEEKSGYILQGMIDKGHCNVPDALRSVRPFRNRPPHKEKDLTLTATSEEQSTDESTGNNSSVEPQIRLKWRLTCWSVDEVKLELDRTEELRYEAIQASWIEAAKGRDTHAAASRLLFLGKTEAAEASMRGDSVNDELMAKYKARLEWLSSASNTMSDGPYLDLLPEVDPTQDILRPENSFDNDDRILNETIESAAHFLQDIREARAGAKDARAQQLKEFVQSVKDRRQDAHAYRQTLYQERDEVLKSKAA